MNLDREDMPNVEAVEMMARCKEEIVHLRRANETLRPKAEAYDAILRILSFLPGKSVAMGEDLVWILEKRIEALNKKKEVVK